METVENQQEQEERKELMNKASTEIEKSLCIFREIGKKFILAAAIMKDIKLEVANDLVPIMRNTYRAYLHLLSVHSSTNNNDIKKRRCNPDEYGDKITKLIVIYGEFRAKTTLSIQEMSHFVSLTRRFAYTTRILKLSLTSLSNETLQQLHIPDFLYIKNNWSARQGRIKKEWDILKPYLRAKTEMLHEEIIKEIKFLERKKR